MYDNFSYRALICTALAMSNMIHTMSHDKKNKEVKVTRHTFTLTSPEPLEFKTAAEIPHAVSRNCKFAGFLTACVKQACIAYLGLSSEYPVAGATGIMMQWPISFMIARALKCYEQKVIDGLHVQQYNAIRVIFDHMHQPPKPLDRKPDREVKAVEFYEKYKQMRSGEIPLELEVVAAHNTVLHQSVALKSFAQGFMYGAALGPLPALLVLHILGRI